MKKLAFILLVLMMIAAGASGQILKGAGIIYFDSLTNVNASTSGAEIAFSIKQKALYKWNRTTSEWDLVVKDTSAFNELQVLYKVGDTLYLTDQITGVSLKPYKNRLHLIATLADTTGITDEIEGDVAYITGGDTIAFRDSLYWLPFFVEAYTDPDPDPTNEIQYIDSLSLSGTTLNASLSNDGVAAKTVNLSGLLTGYISGSLNAGRIPRATGATTIADGVLRDDGSLLAIGGATVSGYSFYDYSTGAWRLATGTTAQRPGSPTAGAMRYNTDNGTWEYYGASAWEVPVKSSTTTGLFTAGSVLFADANGRAAQDNTNFNFDNTNDRLGIKRSPLHGLDVLASASSAIYAVSTGTTNTSAVVVGNRYAGGFLTTSALNSAHPIFWAADGGTLDGSNRISTIGNYRFVVQQTGLIGINTAAPAYSLDINSTTAIRLPVGTTAQRPTGAAGILRYNSTLSLLDYYNGTIWNNIAPSLGAFTSTRIPFSNSSGQLIDDSNLLWDATNDRLGIGITPEQALHLNSVANSTSPVAYLTNRTNNTAVRSGFVIDVGDICCGANYRATSYSQFAKAYTAATWGGSYMAGNSAWVLYSPGDTTNNYVTSGIFTTTGANYKGGFRWHIQQSAGVTPSFSNTTELMRLNLTGLGVKTTTPAQTLHVAGTMRLTGSDGTATKVMGVDADGDVSTNAPGFGLAYTGGVLQVDSTKIATKSDLAGVSVTTLYTGDGTIATDRTVTIGSDKTLTISGTTPDLPGYLFTEEKGYSSDWDTWGNYRLIYTDDYFTNFVQGILNYDSTVFLRISAGDQIGDHFVSMQMDGAGNLSLTGLDDTGTSAGLNLSDNATLGGYGARLAGGTGIEFDADTGGKFVYQINNTTEAQLDATGLGLAGSTPAFTLDMESATDAVDMPGGTTAQRPTNESELLRYNSDNARMEYADGTNWRDLLPATGVTGSAILPSGTTAQRDGSPANGYMRYNTSTGQLEAYVQSAWANISASPRSYADMISSGAATYTESGTPEVIDTVTNIVAVGFTHSAGVLTYTGTTSKNFLVTISAVVGEADTDAATAVLRLYQNSSIKGVSQMYCALQDEKYSMNISRIVTLATNDTLDCRLASSGEWIVSNFYFNVTPID